jgi:hypothetical protein
MMSGGTTPLLKCFSCTNLNQHACKPGMQLSWQHIIVTAFLNFVNFGSLFCLHVTGLDAGNYQLLELGFLALVALLGLFSYFSGSICNSAWLDDLRQACAVAATEKKAAITAEEAEYLLERYLVLSRNLSISTEQHVVFREKKNTK